MLVKFMVSSENICDIIRWSDLVLRGILHNVIRQKVLDSVYLLKPDSFL